MSSSTAFLSVDVPTLSEEGGIRYLHFNSEWIQGAMSVARPSELVLAYTRQMMAWLLFLAPRARDHIGILGLGAGSLLRFVLKHTPAQVSTVERNTQVTAMCRAFSACPRPHARRLTTRTLRGGSRSPHRSTASWP
jgi:spermidine synthase